MLILAEKPSVARKMAFFLSTLGRVVEKRIGKVRYYEILGEEKIRVVAAVGHLYTIIPGRRGFDYPILEYRWVPSHYVRGSEYTREYLEVIRRLASEEEIFVNACDYDTEGSLIGYKVFQNLSFSQARRMKFSAITKADILKAFREMSDLDVENSLAGEARHEVDWLFGINLSRALITALRKAGKNFILSIGRVQGPMLGEIVRREREIREFVPKEFWKIKIKVQGEWFQLKDGEIYDKEKAKRIFSSLSEHGKVLLSTKRRVNINPLPNFDLTELQSTAYSLFKFSPAKTLQLAQSLYEKSMISYPRTSSQKIPDTINVKAILERLSKFFSFAKNAIMFRGKPVQGRKDDKAHPAIHPTGFVEKISEEEKKLYDLIVRRFVASFYPPAVRVEEKISILLNGYEFVRTASKVVEKNWLNVYPFVDVKNERLLQLEKGEIVKIEEKKMTKGKTKPPKRYSQSGIIKKLEEKNIGTKTTRALILEILYKRHYISGRTKILPTSVGEKIIQVFEKHMPELLDEKFTRSLEEKMEMITEGKVRKEEVVEEAKRKVYDICMRMKEEEEEIGKELIRCFSS